MRKCSIKDFSIRATKIDKTQGRPSREEYNASAVMSYFFNMNRKKIEKKITDMVVFGKSIEEKP